MVRHPYRKYTLFLSLAIFGAVDFAAAIDPVVNFGIMPPR